MKDKPCSDNLEKRVKNLEKKLDIIREVLLSLLKQFSKFKKGLNGDK